MTLTSAAGAARASGGLRMTPGRWVAVAFAVPVALALIGWTGFSFVGLVAQGSYAFSYPVQVHDGQVALNVSGGNVTLRSAPGPSARLTGTVQYDLIRPGLREGTSASGLDVAVVGCLGVGMGCGLNAALDVPPRTAVTLFSYGGDVAIASFTGHFTVSTGGGNLNAGHLGGTLQISTSGGDLTGSALTGNVTVFTGGGNLNAGDLAGDLQLNTGGGDLTSSAMSGNAQISTQGGNVTANSVASPQVTVLSGGGDVTLVFTQPPANLQITTYGGNITVDLPPGDTRYDISTNADGGSVTYPSSLVGSTSPDTITADSGGGDITIA
jgi:hypothetical protein